MRCLYRWQCGDDIMGGDQVPLDEDGIIVCPFCEPWRMARVPWSPLPGEGLFGTSPCSPPSLTVTGSDQIA